MPNLRPFDQPVEMLADLVLDKLDLSSEQHALLDRIRNDAAIDETFVVKIVDLGFERDVKQPTAIDGLSMSLSASAGWELDVGFFSPGTRVEREELELPWPDQSIASFDVPLDRVMCGLEMVGELAVGAGLQGVLNGISIGLQAKGKAEMVFRFFKLFAHADTAGVATGSRAVLKSTLATFKTPLTALSRPPAADEVLVAGFDGDLKVGAKIGYGWSLQGSESFGEDLSGVELISRVGVKARIGASASLHLGGEHNLVVRPGLKNPGWINVSYVKRSSKELSLGANLSVDATLATGTADGRTPAAFIDGLLGRTPLPDLMAELRDFDPLAELDEFRDEIKAKTVGRLTEALRSGLEPAAIAADEAFDALRERIEELVRAYAEFEADVLQMAERAVEKYGQLADIDEVVDTIDGFARAEDLQGLLETDVLNEETREKLRAVLRWSREILGGETPLEGWVRDHFSDLRRLVTRYREQREGLTARFEKAYRAVMDELGISRAVDKVRKFLDDTDEFSLQDLLDEKIVWLDRHLSAKIDQPVDRLAEHLGPVKEQLEKLVAGYDLAVAKAHGALTQALNRRLALEASVAWTRLKKNQTLASVDIDPAAAEGRRAYRHLLRGDIRAALELRSSAPHAVRFWKSYLQEDLARGFTFRTVVNGRNRLTVDRFLLNSTTEIQATDDGEIYVQSVRVSDELLHKTRRAVLNVQTLLEVAFEEQFRFVGGELSSDSVVFTRSAISYNFKRELLGTPGMNKIRRELKVVERFTGHLFEEEAMWDRARAELGRVREFGPLREMAIDVDAHLATPIFRTLFRPDRDRGEFRAAIEAAYDATTATMPFGAGATQVTLPFLANTRSTFTDLMLDIHQQLFIEEDSEVVRPLVGRLGKIMRRMNVAGRLQGRNFVMTVFSRLAGPLDRGASLRVGYVHPVTGLAMEIRSDQLPGRIAD